MSTERPAIDPSAFNRFEAAGWQSRADDYHDFFGAVTTRVIDRLLDVTGVGEGSRVLDLATGPGYVARAAAGRGARATGIDVSQGMVELAAELDPRSTYVVGDIEDLPLPDGSFDACVGNFAILHSGRPERTAAELARTLAPGGRAALTVWDVPERSRLLGLFVDAVGEAGARPPVEIPEGPDFFRFSDELEMRALLEGAGLERPAVETIAFEHRLPGPDALWEGVLSGSVRTRALVDGQEAVTRAAIRQAFERLADGLRDGEGIAVPVSVKLGSARKPP